MVEERETEQVGESDTVEEQGTKRARERRMK